MNVLTAYICLFLQKYDINVKTFPIVKIFSRVVLQNHADAANLSPWLQLHNNIIVSLLNHLHDYSNMVMVSQIHCHHFTYNVAHLHGYCTISMCHWLTCFHGYRYTVMTSLLTGLHASVH